jgi:hypothetical protein
MRQIKFRALNTENEMIKEWEYSNHIKGKSPFQPAINLWKKGFVPTFDSKVWRLHTSKDAKIVWEGVL